MENKITDEQLKTIQEQQQQLNNIIHEIAALNDDINDFKVELEKEYGAVNINLEDGTYTAIEQESEVSHV